MPHKKNHSIDESVKWNQFRKRKVYFIYYFRVKNPHYLTYNKKFPQPAMIWTGILPAWCWSTIFSKVICSHLPRISKALYAVICWPLHVWKSWFYFPAEHGTHPQCQKLIWPDCYCAWLALQTCLTWTWKKDIKRERERLETPNPQCKWSEGRWW